MATVNIGRLKFKWQGNYSSGTAYVVDDVVYHGGNSYVCINDSTGNAPTNTSYWQKMAQGSDLGSLSGITQGDVVYYNGTDWTRLAAGTSGQFLKTNGSGANPVWDDVDTDIDSILPSQTSNSGKYLTTDGTNASWGDASAGLKSQQVFDSAGSHTWTKPAGINLIKVYVTGGGGGGGGGTTNYNVGGGGGAGGTAIKIIDVSSVSSVSVTVGNLGSGGGASSIGGTGTSSSFGSYCTANGGAGGFYADSQNQPNYSIGGTCTGGDINIVGGCGEHHGAHNTGDSSGGGHGGSSYWGGGGSSSNYWTGTGPKGGNTIAYGAGGGGGTHNNVGGAGGRAGIVIVEEYA